MKTFTLPENEYYRWKWLLNFAAKVPAVAALFGITKATLDMLTAGSLAVDYTQKMIDALRSNDALFVKAKNGLYTGKDVPPGASVPLPKPPVFPGEAPASVNFLVFDLCITLANNILNSPYITPAIISDLKLGKPENSGIEIPEDRRRPERAPSDQPRVKVLVNGTIITIKITRSKISRQTSANVYVNRGNGNEYKFLGSTIGSTLTDEAVFEPNVDRVTYTYVVEFINKKNEKVGEDSKPVTITVLKSVGM